MTTSVTVRHNFETGHRIPPLAGKCQNLHGHSWWAEVTVTGNLDQVGVVVEYGTVKRLIRDWIDTHWDHGLILGYTDQMAHYLASMGKVYLIHNWPTVETIAGHLAVQAQKLLDDNDLVGTVTRVRVSETHVNAATWEL